MDTVRMLADPSDQVEGLLERLRGPDAGFVADLAAAAELHRPVLVDAGPVAAAVRPYSWLLARIGDDGIPLTTAGYLPPQVVTEAFTELGWQPDRAGAQHREHLAVPVLELRQSARRMALTRTHRGVLLRTATGTRLAHQPVLLWWHMASRLPDARTDAELDAGLLLLFAIASKTPQDHHTAADLLRRGMAALGWHDGRSGQPLDGWQAFEAARGTWECLQRLGAVTEQAAAQPGPASVALARAALRHCLTRPVPAPRGASTQTP